MDKIFLKQGNNLAEELSFVHFFHSEWRNFTLHLLFTPLVFATLMGPFINAFPSTPIFFSVIWGLIYLTWDPIVSIIWIVIFNLIGIYLPNFTQSSQSLITFEIIGLLVPLIAQVFVGHVMFQKRKPAFDVYEAFVTTPFYLILRTLSLFGYRSSLLQEVNQLSQKWSSTWKHQDAK